MTRIIKHSIIAGLLVATIAAPPVSAQVRTKPVLKPVGPVKPAPVPEAAPISKAELSARVKPAPRGLDASQIKVRASVLPGVDGATNWQEAFRLDPVGPYDDKGSMRIEGHMVSTSPGAGQAVIARKSTGWGQAHGGVFMTINAEAGIPYLVSCDAAIEYGQSEVLYAISGASAPASGKAKITDSTLVFDFRGTGGAVDLQFYPNGGKMTVVNGKTVIPNVMDFWGCSVFTGS